MNSKSNGKLIAGLLIMFVVAVSVIGVTYAYFVSTFTPNRNPESVTITAGKLIANYAAGVSITANNVVPGWVSDGLHYYDVDVAAANEGHIYATKKTEGNNSKYANETFGIAKPISFTVTNNSDSEDTDSVTPGVQSPVSYVIRLFVETNGILDNKATANSKGDTALAAAYEKDSKNLLAALYRGTFEDFANAEKISGPFVLGPSGTTHLVTGAAETINTVEDSENYFVMFEYINNQCEAQPSQGFQMVVKAQVDGVQKDNETSTWYDENNTAIDFNSVPAEVDTSYLACTVDGTSKTNTSELITKVPAEPAE